MFERFNDRARRVVVLTQEEARMLNHDYIDTAHILLGLIHEGQGIAAKALESLGISLEAVRQQVEEIIGKGQQAPSGHIPFTPSAKKVLEFSLREALQLGHDYIGTEHILLGLIREGEGMATQALTALKADPQRLQQRVIELLHPPSKSMTAHELRDRVIAPCSVNDAKTGQILGGDPGVLLLRVLLFEENVIDSTYLREFPTLVDSLGAEQVILLLKEGKVQIKCDPRTLGENSESPGFPGRARRSRLPLGTYCFNLGWDLDPQYWFREALDDLLSQLELPQKIASKLESAIEEQFDVLPQDFGQAAIRQLENDLANDRRELFRASLAHVLEVEYNIDAADAAKVWIETQPVGDGAYKTVTNLDSYGIEKPDQHPIVRSALFGVGGLYFRLEEMRALQAVSGFQPDELPLFDAKVDFLARQIIPEAQAERFHRVIRLAGLPNPSEALQCGRTIDIEHLLKLRNSTECQQFRAWLRILDNATDEEIEHHVDSLRSKTAEAIQSKTGRVIRFGTVAGVGFVPGIGLPLGLGLGALDSFVVDRVVGEPGPAIFLSRHYKSIFI